MQPCERPLKDGRTIIIRNAVPEDAPELLEYVEQISKQSDFLSFGPGEFDLTESEERNYLANVLNANNQVYLVAVVEQSIVGAVNFYAPSRKRVRHSGEIGMSVHQDYWRLGIGSALMDALITWAESTEVVTKLNLRVRTDNRRAIALYEQKGFEREGTIRNDMKLDGEYHHHHWMGRILD